MGQGGGHSELTLIDGLWTHAWVRGQGRPLVIVPGLGCASWMYRRLARELAAERLVYVYDPPGHGLSQGRRDDPVNIRQLTDHLAAWLTANDLHGVPLLGHSLGGEVLFDLAARYPDHASALVACAPTGIPHNPNVAVQLLHLLLDLPHERLPLLLSGFRAYAVAGARRIYVLAHNQSQHQTGPLLPHIRVPTLLLNGKNDPVIHDWTVETIERGIPEAVVKLIPGGTHALTDSYPRTVARFTLDFLKLIEDDHNANWEAELETGMAQMDTGAQPYCDKN